MNHILESVEFSLDIAIKDGPILPPQYARGRELIPRAAVVRFLRRTGGSLLLKRVQLTGFQPKKDGTASQATNSADYWCHVGDREGQLMDAPIWVHELATDARAMLMEQLR